MGKSKTDIWNKIRDIVLNYKFLIISNLIGASLGFGLYMNSFTCGAIVFFILVFILLICDRLETVFLYNSSFHSNNIIAQISDNINKNSSLRRTIIECINQEQKDNVNK